MSGGVEGSFGEKIMDRVEKFADKLESLLGIQIFKSRKELKELGDDFMGSALNNLENNVGDKTNEIQSILYKKLKNESTVLSVLSGNKDISDYMNLINLAEQSKKDLGYEILFRCIKKESNDDEEINESDLKRREFNELGNILGDVNKLISSLKSSNTGKTEQDIVGACITVLEGSLKAENYDITKIKIDDDFRKKVVNTLQQQIPNGNQENPNGNQENPNGNQENPNGNQENPNGNQENPNGNQENPNGNQESPNGNQENPNDRDPS